MVKGICPYCDCEVELQVAGFASSTHPKKCPECGEQYHVIDIPPKGLKAITKDDFQKKYAHLVDKN